MSRTGKRVRYLISEESSPRGKLNYSPKNYIWTSIPYLIYRVVAVPSSPPCSCRCLATSGASRDRFAAVGAELFFARVWVAGLPGSWMMIARFSCLACNLFLVSWCFLGFPSVFSVSFSPVWDFLPSVGGFFSPLCGWLMISSVRCLLWLNFGFAGFTRFWYSYFVS